MFNITAGFEMSTAKQLASNLRTFPSRLPGVRSTHEKSTGFSLLKNTRIHEEYTFQFRWEAYSAWNQHFFTTANTKPTNSAFETSQTATSPRARQLGLRFMF